MRTHLDGNAIGGLLGEIFAADLTTAVGTCDGCGARTVVAEVRVYLRAPGVVVRCPGCDSVLMRIAEIHGRHVVDLGGLRALDTAQSP